MSNSAATQVSYQEWVTPKWSSFLPLALIFPTFWLTLAPINAPIGIGLGVLVTVAVAASMLVTSARISVSATQLTVGNARINLEFTGKVEIVPFAPRFAQRVPNLDPRAYLKLQGSRKGMLKLEIQDKADPTPYWVFSTKNPELLAAAIHEAKKAI